MDKSPKYYQKNKQYDNALEIFIQNYKEELYNGDFYLSQLYMDEIIQTILEKAVIEQNDEKLDNFRLRSIVWRLFKEEEVDSDNYSEQIDNDLEISIAKRFPHSKVRNRNI